MTIAENVVADKPIEAEKVDTNISQQKVDANLTQNTEAGKEEDPNWRAFREARKKDREERIAAEKRANEKEAEAAALKAAMEAAFSKSAPPVDAYQQYYGQPEETDDEKIEKKVNAILASREEQARKAAYEREKQEYPNRLVKDFPDFNHVIAQENLDYMDYHYPEVSRPLQRLQDGYEKWSDIYHAVKKFVPNNTTARKEAAKAESNQMKPKSISTSTMTNSGEPVRNSIQEVEQRRADNWARMQRILKGV